MKKILLIMVSVLILTIFISFNYLLWFRDGQIAEYKADIERLSKDLTAEESNFSSIINQSASNVSMRDAEITKLDKKLAILETGNSKLEQDNQQLMANNNIKDAIISKLKLQADLEPLKTIIRNWVDYIDTARYDDAYKLLKNAPISQDSAKAQSGLLISNYSNVKGVKVKTIELLTEELLNDKKGDIIFKVVVDVTKVDDTASGELVKGINNLYFTMQVQEYSNEWVISNIQPTRLN